MRRSEFTAQTKRDAYKRADGCCQSCAVKLRDGESQYHHVIEARLGGTNSLANCLVLCPRCHKAVTKDTSIPRITRMKHMRDASINARGPKAKIPSRRKVRTISDKIGLPPRRNILTGERYS